MDSKQSTDNQLES